MNVLGRNLKHFREFHDLTQAFVGSLLGLAQSSYCRRENGQRGLSEAQRTRLAEYYGISTETLTAKIGARSEGLSQTGEHKAKSAHEDPEQNALIAALIKHIEAEHEERISELQNTNRRLLDLLEKHLHEATPHKHLRKQKLR